MVLQRVRADALSCVNHGEIQYRAMRFFVSSYYENAYSATDVTRKARTKYIMAHASEWIDGTPLGWEILGLENPHVNIYVCEAPPPIEVTAWCAFCGGCVIGPFSLKIMLDEREPPDRGRNNQYTGDTTSVRVVLYPKRGISIGLSVCSPDLSPLDSFVWLYFKGRACANTPTIIRDLIAIRNLLPKLL